MLWTVEHDVVKDTEAHSALTLCVGGRHGLTSKGRVKDMTSCEEFPQPSAAGDGKHESADGLTVMDGLLLSKLFKPANVFSVACIILLQGPAPLDVEERSCRRLYQSR